MKEIIAQVRDQDGIDRNIVAVAYRGYNDKPLFELRHEWAQGDIVLSKGFSSLQECSLAAYAAWGLQEGVEFRFVKVLGLVFDENEKLVVDMVRVIAIRYGDHWKMYLASRDDGIWPAAHLSDQSSLPACRRAAFAEYRTFSAMISAVR
jgi:hypothetical protein